MEDKIIKWLFNALLCLGMACISLIEKNPNLLEEEREQPKEIEDAEFEEVKE